MNDVDPPSFAERLMKSEPGNDDLRRRYEEGKLALIERRLTPWQRPEKWALVRTAGLRLVDHRLRIRPPEGQHP